MKAIQVNPSVPRYLVGRSGRFDRRLYWSGLSIVYADDVPEPPLPNGEWVTVGTRLGGICGTDMDIVQAKPIWYFEPFSSFPCTLGHEVVGTVARRGDAVEGWQVGDRVVVEPLLWCRPRGFDEPCRFCRVGEINRCERITEGAIAPGLLIGGCRSTGGGWSANFIAHQSQLYHVPPSVSDTNAVLVEPFSVALHAVSRSLPADHERVLIVGAGTIGLLTVAALRALGSQAEVLVLARHEFQSEAARRLGATDVLVGADFEAISARVEGRLFKPTLGRPVALGGVDRSFECVGNPRATDDALRLTRAGGTVTLVGAPVRAKDVDWTMIQAQELRVEGSMYYDHAADFGGRTWTTFELALDLMASGKVDLGWMVTHRFTLADHPRAFEMLIRRNRHSVLKAVFEFSA